MVDDQENRGKRKAWRTCQARSHRLTISVISHFFKLLSNSLEFDVQELWTLIWEVQHWFNCNDHHGYLRGVPCARVS